MNEILSCVSPIDGKVYAEREFADSVAANQIARAQKAQHCWAARPLAERIEIVRRGTEELCAQSEEAVPELAWMMGRPVRYGGEFGGVMERASYMADIAESALSPIVAEESAQFSRRIVREAAGVVLVVSPWNYPYLTAINTVAPALIAGNAVILKPSAQTPVAGERIARAYVAAGVPDDVMQNLFLSRAATLSLIAKGVFDFVNFTGSTEGGRAVAKAAADSFSGIGLELGGKDPAYVMEDADVESAAADIMDAAFFNSGQCCCGIERAYVAESRFDSFVEKACEIAYSHALGNPLEKETTLGPMAARRFADGARAQLANAESCGAKLLIDKNKFADDDGAYFAPQIAIDVTHEMELMREENFAPIIGIMPVANDDEAADLMNASDYGLTASLWTRDAERAAAVGAKLQTGTVFMNRADYLDPALCWSGRKNTGRGASLSALGYYNLTRTKSYHLKKKGAEA